jgi:hypothetical protein
VGVQTQSQALWLGKGKTLVTEFGKPYRDGIEAGDLGKVLKPGHGVYVASSKLALWKNR